MKKFIKYGMIAGFVMILAGTGITTASVAMGASMKRIGNMLEERFNGSFMDWSDWNGGHRIDVTKDGVYVSAGEHSIDVSEDGVRVSSGNSSLSVNGEEPPQTELEAPGDEDIREQWVSPGTEGGFEAGYPIVTELDIRQSGGSVAVYALENIGELTVKSKNGSLSQLSYKEAGEKSRLTVRVKGNEEYQIFIPASWELENLEAEVKGGALNGSDIRAYKAEFHASGGAIAVSQRSGYELELECSSGGLVWTASEEMEPDVKAECRNGAIAIAFPDTMDSGDFQYDILCENGKVEAPEFSINGTEKREISGKSGMPRLKIEVKNGAVSVNQ